MIGSVILVFVALELSPRFAALSLPPVWLPLGGLASGFFGGLSGHQGAFRSLFLRKLGLDKHAFVATGVLIAVLVDLARTLVYGLRFLGQRELLEGRIGALAGVTSLAAFAGAYLGALWLEKLTIESVQRIVSATLVSIAFGLMTGLV